MAYPTRLTRKTTRTKRSHHRNHHELLGVLPQVQRTIQRPFLQIQTKLRARSTHAPRHLVNRSSLQSFSMQKGVKGETDKRIRAGQETKRSKKGDSARIEEQ